MTDLVGTCPKGFWSEWIAEGDTAGDPSTGAEYGWFTRDPKRHLILPGERFYIVAHGRLRGYAPVLRVERGAIVRGGGAVAMTIEEAIPGFMGLRRRWWPREAEQPFPDWRTVGVEMGSRNERRSPGLPFGEEGRKS